MPFAMAAVGCAGLAVVGCSGSGEGTVPGAPGDAIGLTGAAASAPGAGGSVMGAGGSVVGTGSSAATGGLTASGGSTGVGGDTSSCTEEELAFSFFATSLEGIRMVSGSADGFGGDLGGLAGADSICQAIAVSSTPCAANRRWRAFLSTVDGPVHARDRIGEGPWYDRLGRVVALTKADLLNDRPVGADPAIINDLPNEFGVPNHDPDGAGEVDNHDFLTGTDDEGGLFDTDPVYTCSDWTSAVPSGSPRCGHTWPTSTGWGGRPGGGGGSMANWMSALNEAGCAPADTDTSLIESGAPDLSNPTVGSGGGYGGIYCFALN